MRTRTRRSGMSVGGLLALVLLVPMIGMSALTWSMASQRWAERTQASEVHADADGLDFLVHARGVLNDEWTQSGALASAADRGLSPEQLALTIGVDVTASLKAVRQSVSLGDVTARYPELRADVAAVIDARAVVDGDPKGALDTINAAFSSLTQHVDRIWGSIFGRVRSLIESSSQMHASSAMHVRLDALEAAFRALTATMDRGKFANFVLGGATGTANVSGYLEAQGRYNAETTDLVAHLGPKGVAAWDAWRASPDTEHVEALIASSMNTLLADPSKPVPVDVDTYNSLMTEGVRWMSGMTAVVTATAVDLADLADRQFADASHALLAEGLITIGLVIGVLFAGVALTHAVARPLRRLAVFAREIERGRFTQPPPPITGPREVAETTSAIADMTATVAAVEAYVIELADDPNSPALDEPLPGRTGRALQTTVNHLRQSMRAAERTRRQLEDLATHDGLTGLLNRGAALDAIDRDLAAVRRDGELYAVVFLDVDGLKAINDTYGHDAGDATLLATADALRTSTRRSDVIARIGGDEFLVGARGHSRDDISMLTERIMGALAGKVIVADGHPLAVRSSIGIALAASDETSAKVIQHADRALYRAKHEGRARRCWYDEPVSRSA